LDRNRAVLDLVASDHLEILHGRVTQRGGVLAVSSLDLSLREAFFVLGDSVNESKASLTLDRNADRSGASEFIFGLFSDSRWTTNIKSLLSYVILLSQIAARN
jgi:hypothetical protein